MAGSPVGQDTEHSGMLVWPTGRSRHSILSELSPTGQVQAVKKNTSTNPHTKVIIFPENIPPKVSRTPGVDPWGPASHEFEGIVIKRASRAPHVIII